MKKLVLALIIVLVPAWVVAQNSAIDHVFEKYSGKDGFVSIQISKGLLKLAAGLDEDGETDKLLKSIDGIKILAVEDEELNAGLNFYNEVMSSMKTDNYEELMTVNSSDADIIFLAKKKGDRISEFILLVGGDDDNALIYISGNILLKDISKLSKSLNIEGSGLEKLEMLDDADFHEKNQGI